MTWDTANPWATSPEFLKTPKYPIFGTPGKSPVPSSGTKRPLSSQDLEAQLATHVHHLSPNPNLSLPPVEPSRQLSSSPNPSSAKRPCHRPSEPELTPLKTGLDQEASSSMHSASSMQTPPPTSTSASRRKAQQAQAAKILKQSSTSGRRMSSPNLQSTDHAEASYPHIEASPGFPNLQFSPEVSNFPASGPATAPVFPQHKLFWDPQQSNENMNLDFNNSDMFALGIEVEKHLDPFSSHQTNAMTEAIPSSSFNDLNGSQDDLAVFPVSAKAPARKFSRSRLTTSVVDPNMLFSSPGHPPKLPSPSQPDLDDTLQPYAHQIQDAQREDELRLGTKQKRRRGPEVDSPAVRAALQTLRDEESDHLGMKRSVTDSVLESFKGRAPQSSVSRRTSVKQHNPHRRSSPVKNIVNRYPGNSLNDRKASKKTTLTLTIDASGRAKTETKVVGGNGKPLADLKTDVDGLSTESETSSSEEDNFVTSRHQSFNLSMHEPAKIKMARFTADSRGHSQRSSYTSTIASTNTGNGGLFPRGKLGRRIASTLPQHLDDSSHLSVPMSDQDSSSTFISDRLDGKDGAVSEIETVIDSDEDNGDAQLELKKVIQSRAQRKTAHSFRSGSQRQRSAQYPEPSYGGQLAPYPYQDKLTPSHKPYNNISPTTITDPDYATPNSTADSQISESTRCVCHAQDTDGEFMIMW